MLWFAECNDDEDEDAPAACLTVYCLPVSWSKQINTTAVALEWSLSAPASDSDNGRKTLAGSSAWLDVAAVRQHRNGTLEKRLIVAALPPFVPPAMLLQLPESGYQVESINVS